MKKTTQNISPFKLILKRNTFLLALLTIVLSSCCKVNLPVGVDVQYPNLDHETSIVALITAKGDPSTIIDTIMIAELNAENNYSKFVNFRDPHTYDYIIQADSANYSDTISNFTYEVKGFNCNQRVKSVEYYHNGNRVTGMNLVIF